MEARGQGHGHAPPFWASSSSSPTSSTNASTSTQSGIRPWVVVVVMCIAVLLFFFPSVVTSPFKSGRVSLSVKSGWDMLNVCLVVFAIACGVLGRIGEGSSGQDYSGGSFKQQVRSDWNGYGDANRMAAAAMSRRMMMRSGSSYPDLRTEMTAVWGQSNRAPDGWRPYDDDGGQLDHAPSRPVQMYQMPGFGEEERECKTVSNDTGSGTIDYGQEWQGREATVARRRMRSLEALPRWEQEQEQEEGKNEPPVVVAAGRWRRRSLERFPSIEENMEKETHFLKMEAELGADDDRMVKERPPLEEEEEMVKRTEESLPEIEEKEKDGSFEEENVTAEKTPVVVEVVPPPPPPPPPPEAKPAEECGKHRRSDSGGGAKDLASTIALFYQKKKKKGSKSKRKEKHEQEQLSSIVESNPNSNSNLVTESNNGNASGGTAPSTAPPPPPPPPPAPSSIFHQLFSNKKGASKSRRIHSLSASTYSSTHSAVNAVSAPPPAPPMLRPPHQGSHRAQKNEVASTGYRRIEDTELYHEHRRTRERSNLSPYAHYPLPPRSPLPPPPPSPPPVCENVTEKIGSPAAVCCPSPDVNDKADLFIRRFRDGLKLEKINSIKEKVKRKGRLEEDEMYDDEIQT